MLDSIASAFILICVALGFVMAALYTRHTMLIPVPDSNRTHDVSGDLDPEAATHIVGDADEDESASLILSANNLTGTGSGDISSARKSAARGNGSADREGKYQQQVLSPVHQSSTEVTPRAYGLNCWRVNTCVGASPSQRECMPPPSCIDCGLLVHSG